MLDVREHGTDHRWMRTLIRRSGFSIVELLMVVAVIGVLSAIIIPNMLSAIQRSKQKRTMADMRAFAVAWEAYGVDKGRFNSPAWTPLTPASLETEVRPVLVPTFAKTLPPHDGWGRPWHLGTDQAWDSAIASSRYQIASGGRNGVLETSSLGLTTHFDCDLVWESGSFVVWPEGLQSDQ